MQTFAKIKHLFKKKVTQPAVLIFYPLPESRYTNGPPPTYHHTIMRTRLRGFTKRLPAHYKLYFMLPLQHLPTRFQTDTGNMISPYR